MSDKNGGDLDSQLQEILKRCQALKCSVAEDTCIDNSKFRLGDHLMVSRGLYSHHGIYVGRNHVIHYSGLSDGLLSGPVTYDTIAVFSRGEEVVIREYSSSKFSGMDVVRRAESRLGEDRYDVHSNNCEDFCSWAITGESRSEQVELAESVLRVVFPVAGAAASLRKHASRDVAGGGGGLASTVSMVALGVISPALAPSLVAGKIFKWINK